MAYSDEKETKAGSKASKRAKNKGYTSEGTTKKKKTKQGKPTGPRKFFGKLANLFRKKSKKKRYKITGTKRTEKLGKNSNSNKNTKPSSSKKVKTINMKTTIPGGVYVKDKQLKKAQTS